MQARGQDAARADRLGDAIAWPMARSDSAKRPRRSMISPIDAEANASRSRPPRRLARRLLGPALGARCVADGEHRLGREAEVALQVSPP
jgi:hypothetical protein